MTNANASANVIALPLLEQVSRLGLVDGATLDEVSAYAGFKPFAPYFMRPLQPRLPMTETGEPTELEDFDYEFNPGWMIALSPRFGRRYLTDEQRRKLLAAATPRIWEGALIAAKQRYQSVHISGGSKEFGCNQQYALLLDTSWRMLLHGREGLLCSFLRLFRYSLVAGGHLYVTGTGFSLEFDGDRHALNRAEDRAAVLRGDADDAVGRLGVDDLNAWMHELGLPLKAVMLGRFSEPSPGAMMHGGNIIRVKTASLTADGAVHVAKGNDYWHPWAKPGTPVLRFENGRLIAADGVKTSLDGDLTWPVTSGDSGVPALMDTATGLFMPVPQGYAPVWDPKGQSLALRRCEDDPHLELAIQKTLHRMARVAPPSEGTLSDARRAELLRGATAGMPVWQAVDWIGKFEWTDFSRLTALQ